MRSFLADAQHRAVQPVGLEKKLLVALGLVRDAVDHIAALHGVVDLVRTRRVGHEVLDVQLAEHGLRVVAMDAVRITH